jgi:hypothetical protein
MIAASTRYSEKPKKHYTTKHPAVAGGVFGFSARTYFARRPHPTKVGDVLLGDVLCPALQALQALQKHRFHSRSGAHPQMLHFLQVPLPTIA